jgi:hypothetical protein
MAALDCYVVFYLKLLRIYFNPFSKCISVFSFFFFDKKKETKKSQERNDIHRVPFIFP